MANPCRNCDDRNAECHANCEKYREFRVKKDKQMKQREMEQLGTPDPCVIIKRIMRKEMKRR